MTRHSRPTLCICQCPQHRDFWSVTIDTAGAARRVTPSKCCGQWSIVKEWLLSSREWHELADEAFAIADIAEKNEQDAR